jgi:hypothetical protein
MPNMTAEEKVFAILRDNSGVVALVPAARIKVPGDWQGLAKPYIVHFPVAAEATDCHDGPKEFRIWHSYQVSVFGATYSEAKAAAVAVEAALNGYSDEVTDRISLLRPAMSLGYDTDLKAAHIVLDFEIAGALA